MHGPHSGDYYPCVIYNKDQFEHGSVHHPYRMWHHDQNAVGVATSYSDDGIKWTLEGSCINIPSDATARHPFVIYDKNGFVNPDDGYTYFYRLWCWNSPILTTPDAIRYSFSTDGIIWTNLQPCEQDAYYPIVFGSSGYFYHLYGPGFVIYNPSATKIPDKPYTWPYAMFFDCSSESPFPGPNGSIEACGLAYSDDGIIWTRFGDVPAVIPPGISSGAWDATYIYRPSVCIINGTYHMYYCGSNGDPAIGHFVDPDNMVSGASVTPVSTAHGIGHASSTNGINWLRDPG